MLKPFFFLDFLPPFSGLLLKLSSIFVSSTSLDTRRWFVCQNNVTTAFHHCLIMGEVQSPGAATPQVDEPSPGLPDYVLSPNAVFGDEGVQWRYGKPPDYSKTRKVWAEGTVRISEGG